MLCFNGWQGSQARATLNIFQVLLARAVVKGLVILSELQ
jgi:hypothetical protein